MDLLIEHDPLDNAHLVDGVGQLDVAAAPQLSAILLEPESARQERRPWWCSTWAARRSSTRRRSASSSAPQISPGAGKRLFIVAPEGPVSRPRADEPQAALHGLLGPRRGHLRGHPDRLVIPMRVVVADDTMLLREGVARLLAEAGFDVVGRAANAEDLMLKVASYEPDVAIVDLRMPPTHTDEGIRAALQIRRALPGDRRARALPARRHGLAMKLLAEAPRASATCSRTASPTSRTSPTRSAGSAAGGSALDPSIVSQLLPGAATGGPLDELTAARARGARADGRGPLQPGHRRALEISERGVQKHVTSIFDKLGIPAGTDDHRRVLAVLTFLRRCKRPRRCAFAYPGHRRARSRGLRTGTVTLTPERREPMNRSSSQDSPTPLASSSARASSAATARARPPSTRCAASTRRSRSGQPHRRHGPVGLRQVDADAHPRRARPADRGQRDDRRPGHRQPRDNELTLLRREHIGFIFQFFNLLPMLTAAENVVLPLSLAGVKPDQEWVSELTDKRRPQPPPRPPPVGALRRPAAARRDRPRARLAADDHVRRRADRQPRLHAPAARSWRSCATSVPTSARRP